MDRDTIIEIVDTLRKGENVLVCAPGGTGKSYSLKEVALELLTRGIKVYCTATTGVASLNLVIPGKLGSYTVHRWAGIKLGQDTPENLVKKMYPDARMRWVDCDVLAIDEISMMGLALFDKLDEIARIIRRNNKPFGGIALMVSGDFLQLPPVKDEWVFKSKVWDNCAFSVYILSTPMRYDDTDYYNLLLRVRESKHTDQDLATLDSRVTAYLEYIRTVKNTKELTIKPTMLYSRKINVDIHNLTELNKLPGQAKEFNCVDMYNCHPKQKSAYASILDDAIPQIITLKVGAQVMLMFNDDPGSGLVNGSRGVITALAENAEEREIGDVNPFVIEVKFYCGVTKWCKLHKWTVEENGKVLAMRMQVPFILAWSLTIHKSQGCTLDFAVCDIGESVFAPGQAYVALSRVRNLKGLFLSDFSKNAIKADKVALDYVTAISSEMPT